MSCASILSARYNLKVNVYESHYHPGGVAHSFPLESRGVRRFNFDSGPTIILGCSQPPFNPLQQVLRSVGADGLVDWITYDSWGMCTEEGDWQFRLGEGHFEAGPLARFGGPKAVEEFQALRRACLPLCAGAASIPTKALRGDAFKLLPLLPYFSALRDIIPYADVLEGSFAGLLETHVKDPWLRSWLDALAFSLSGLPAAQTGAATMAYTLFDLHRPGALMDYPRGGVGRVTEALCEVIRGTGSHVHLSSPVRNIQVQGGRARGVQLRNGDFIKAKKGVVCNADVWTLPGLLSEAEGREALSAKQRGFLRGLEGKAMTKSFMHLHLGLDSTGLNQQEMLPHYTVMAQGLHTPHDPCGDRNMVAVSNPSVLDQGLVTQGGLAVPRDRAMVVHAYGAANEPYDDWRDFLPNARPSQGYRKDPRYLMKREASMGFLRQSISRALRIDEKELIERSEILLPGSPLTHQRFTRKTRGTYGAAWGSMLPGPTTPLPGLLLCGDSVFPGIGVPAVALSGAAAANTAAGVVPHLLDLLKE